MLIMFFPSSFEHIKSFPSILVFIMIFLVLKALSQETSFLCLLLEVLLDFSWSTYLLVKVKNIWLMMTRTCQMVYHFAFRMILNYKAMAAKALESGKSYGCNPLGIGERSLKD